MATSCRVSTLDAPKSSCCDTEKVQKLLWEESSPLYHPDKFGFHKLGSRREEKAWSGLAILAGTIQT